MKRVVKLTEQDLYRIVKRVIKEQSSTTPPQAAATTQQPTSAFVQGVTRNANSTELMTNYNSLGGLQTGREVINYLLPEGNTKKMFIAKADQERDSGKPGIATNFLTMIRSFLEYTWKGKVDLNKYKANVLFPSALKNNETYKLLVSKESPVKLQPQDWENIYNKLKEYQQSFRFPS